MGIPKYSVNCAFKSTSGSFRSGLKMPSVRTSSLDQSKSSILKSGLMLRNTTSKALQNLFPKSAASIISRDVHDTTASYKKRPGFRRKRSEQHEQMTKNGYFSVNAVSSLKTSSSSNPSLKILFCSMPLPRATTWKSYMSPCKPKIFTRQKSSSTRTTTVKTSLTFCTLQPNTKSRVRLEISTSSEKERSSCGIARKWKAQTFLIS
jgi:hypothetical protein